MIAQENGSIYRTIPHTIVIADTFTSRLKGLMFRRTPIEQEGLWIVPCNSIHMCFMFFSIDVVFLDKNQKIVHLVRNLKPWKFVAPVKNAHSVLELPAGTIEEFTLVSGQYIKLA